MPSAGATARSGRSPVIGGLEAYPRPGSVRAGSRATVAVVQLLPDARVPQFRLLRDRSGQFRELGVAIIGISRDSPYSHLEWAKRLGLSYPLLSDWNGEAVRAFGVAQELDGLVDTPLRSCFIVDSGGVMRFARVYEDSQVPDVDELLAEARAITAGG